MLCPGSIQINYEFQRQGTCGKVGGTLLQAIVPTVPFKGFLSGGMLRRAVPNQKGSPCFGYVRERELSLI